MNPPNILGEPPIQDEDMNPHEQPVEGEERSLSGMSNFGKNNNNGLLFAPTCTTCFNENKYLSTSKKSVPTNEIMSTLIALESTFFFPQGCFIVDTTMTNPTRFFIQAQLFCAPTEYTNVLQLPRSMMKGQGKDVTRGHLDESTLLELRDDIINNWDIHYSNPKY